MSGVRRAWGWVASLRDGGTVPWAEWTTEGEERGPWLPGAQQLELLRRVNEEAVRRGVRTDPLLVDRLLAASAPGRGRPDLLLAGAGPDPRFGPRPVDPAALPPRDLVRVASGLIAEDLVAAGVPEPRPRHWWQRRRPWAPRYRLVGHPWLVEPALDDLARRGRPQRERPHHVYVLAADLETMVAHAWTARAFAEGGAGWTEWLRGLARADRLPPRADVLTPARTWGERIGPGHVSIVLDNTLLPARIRGRRGLAGPPEIGGAAADLARWVGASLALLVGREQREALLRGRLAPRLAGLGGPAVAVPKELRGWTDDRAERLRAQLTRGGYPFVGDPDLLLAPATDRDDDRSEPSEAEVLALATQVLIEPARPVARSTKEQQ